MYGIKIDKRKKLSFNNAILECIASNQLWCNESEDGYVEKKYAKRFPTRSDADQTITEEWEIVCII